MKKTAALFLFLSLSLFAVPLYASQDVTVHFFWGNGCPHCNKEKQFLDRLRQKYPGLSIKSYEVWYNADNAQLFAKMSEAYGKKVAGVPTLFIGSAAPIVGYLSDEVTGKKIEEAVSHCIESGCIDPQTRVTTESSEGREVVSTDEMRKPKDTPETELPPQVQESVTGKKGQGERETRQSVPPREREEVVPERSPGREQPSAGGLKEAPKEVPQEEQKTISLPVIGELDPSKTSLPVLTLIIAGLDGFNPCAFFVLFLLLSILVYAHSRKLMLLIGGTFVFFSGLIYFLFMSAWLNLFLVFGQIRIITSVAGMIALVIALINIKDFFFFKKGVSLVIPEKAKPKLYERTRGLLKRGSALSMMTGTVVLAIAANTYELLCTAGFPMVYTRTLTLHNLPLTSYYLYLVFYNLVYVIPLAVIVVAFSVTLGARKLTERQGQILKLISGLMMLCLSLILVIRPELLNNIIVSAGLLFVSLGGAWVIIFVTDKLRGGWHSH